VHWYNGMDYVGWSPLSYYNRPVVILNNHFYGRYYDSDYPVHSRALTVIRKDQLSARHVSKVALGQSGLSRLGKISLSARQPNIRPASSRMNLKSSKALKALSRSNVRSVSKSYSSGKSIRSSRGENLANPALSPQKRFRTTGPVRSNVQSQPARSRNSRSAIKTYPSRNSLSVKSTRTYSSSRPSVKSSRTTSSLKTRSSVPNYPSRFSTSARSRSSSTARSSYSSVLKRYSSQSRSRMRPTSSQRSTPKKLTYRSSSSRSSYSRPSRSSPKIRSFSSSYKSYSPSRVSPSRSSSSSRSFRSTSRPRASRSYPARTSSSRSRSSSRSSSAKRVKK